MVFPCLICISLLLLLFSLFFLPLCLSCYFRSFTSRGVFSLFFCFCRFSYFCFLYYPLCAASSFLLFFSFFQVTCFQSFLIPCLFGFVVLFRCSFSSFFPPDS